MLKQGGQIIFDNASGLGGNTTKMVVSRKVVAYPSSGSFTTVFSDFNVTIKVGYSSSVPGAFIAFSPTATTNWNFSSFGVILNTAGSILDPYSTSGLYKAVAGSVSGITSGGYQQITPYETSVSSSGIISYLSQTDSPTSPAYVINSQTISTSGSSTDYINVIVTAYY